MANRKRYCLPLKCDTPRSIDQIGREGTLSQRWQASSLDIRWKPSPDRERSHHAPCSTSHPFPSKSASTEKSPTCTTNPDPPGRRRHHPPLDCARPGGGSHRRWLSAIHVPRRPTGERWPTTTATPENPGKRRVNGKLRRHKPGCGKHADQDSRGVGHWQVQSWGRPLAS